MVAERRRAVVVGAGRQRLPVRRRAVRGDAVLARERRDHLRRQPLEHRRQIRFDSPVGAAVRPLERREHQQDLLEGRRVEARVGADQRVGEPVRDRGAVQVLAQAIDVVAARLDLVVLVAGDVPGEDVHDAAVLGEAGGHLFGQEEVRPIDQRQTSVDRVVVRQRHQRHARAPCRDRTGAQARHSSPASRTAACTTRRSQGTPPSECAGRSALCASCPGAGRWPLYRQTGESPSSEVGNLVGAGGV